MSRATFPEGLCPRPPPLGVPRLTSRSCRSAAPATIMCPNSASKFAAEHQGKGYYEVVGTLSNGAISEMATVYMGENLGELSNTVIQPTSLLLFTCMLFVLCRRGTLLRDGAADSSVPGQ
jgi:hypothetical protein